MDKFRRVYINFLLILLKMLVYIFILSLYSILIIYIYFLFNDIISYFSFNHASCLNGVKWYVSNLVFTTMYFALRTLRVSIPSLLPYEVELMRSMEKVKGHVMELLCKRRRCSLGREAW